jgi:hypothetical protein
MFILNEVLVRINNLSQKQMKVMILPYIARDEGAGAGLKVRSQGNECRVNKM